MEINNDFLEELENVMVLNPTLRRIKTEIEELENSKEVIKKYGYYKCFIEDLANRMLEIIE